MLDEVPEIIAAFSIVEVLSTTVGKTFADYLDAEVGLGLWGAHRGDRQAARDCARPPDAHAPLLPARLLARSSAGEHRRTLITKTPSPTSTACGCPVSTVLFAVALAATFAIWYRSEGTLSIHTIVTSKREGFYWLAILFAFSLGTAAGDYLSEDVGLGYLKKTGLLLVVLILATWLAYRFASLGEVRQRLLGGLRDDATARRLDRRLPHRCSGRRRASAFSVNAVSWTFFAAIIALVAWMTLKQRAPERAEMAALGGDPDEVPEINSVDAFSGLAGACRTARAHATASAAPIESPSNMRDHVVDVCLPGQGSVSVTSIAIEDSAPTAVATTTRQHQQDPRHERPPTGTNIATLPMRFRRPEPPFVSARRISWNGVRLSPVPPASPNASPSVSHRIIPSHGRQREPQDPPCAALCGGFCAHHECTAEHYRGERYAEAMGFTGRQRIRVLIGAQRSPE